jgi:hypothetical protein
MFSNNKINPLHVLAIEGHSRKAINISREKFHMCYVHVLSCKGQNISISNKKGKAIPVKGRGGP